MSYINATTAYPPCPYCNIELDDIDTSNFELADEIAIFQCVGTYPYYKHNFKWNGTYKWDIRFYDLKEISDP